MSGLVIREAHLRSDGSWTCIVRANSYDTSMGFLNKLASAIKADFPGMADHQIEVMNYEDVPYVLAHIIPPGGVLGVSVPDGYRQVLEIEPRSDGALARLVITPPWMHALFREALQLLVDEPVPEWARMHAERIGDGTAAIQLQDWVCPRVRPSWATGLGAIEAAESMVHEAISNGNIDEGMREAYGHHQG